MKGLLRKHVAKFVQNIVIKHNGYLEKNKAITTDRYVFNPYMLGENLEKRNKQPKYIRTNSIIDVHKIIDAIITDGATKFKADSMLKTCVGKISKNMVTLRSSKLDNVSEKLIHKCRILHHKNPDTKLGPFKLEILHHEPFIMIFHELFTEEDTNHLVDWARPKLSRKIDGILEKDQVKKKTDYLTRTIVSFLKFLISCLIFS